MKEWIQKLKSNVYLSAAFTFISVILFIFLFGKIFGSANVLPGVAVYVGVSSFPYCNINLKFTQASFLIITLFTGSALTAYFCFFNPFASFTVSLLFTFVILLFTCEPMTFKPYVSFMLSYIFCLMSPVTGHDFLLRIAGLLSGSILTIILSVPKWKKMELENDQLKSFKDQAVDCYTKHKGFILRMSTGFALALFIGLLLHLKKPVWIGIAVFSLTQVKLEDSLSRIKYRTIGTGFGVLLLLLVSMVFPRYVFLLPFLLGYIGSLPFAKHYKYQQVINTMNAIYASFIVFPDSSAAIFNRIVCLIGGAAIVYITHVLHIKLKQKIYRPIPE